MTLGMLKALGGAYARWYRRFDLCPKTQIDTTSQSRAAVAARVVDALASIKPAGAAA